MRIRILAISAVLLLGAVAPATSRADLDLAAYVDPMIGTLGSGFVFPGPAAPFGMVQLSPDTEGYFAYTGYQYGDTSIRGFSHVHTESMGVHEGGDVPFMPTVGPVVSTDPGVFRSKFEHATEEASPGYYKVILDASGVKAELTAGTRVGMHRYTFPPTSQANIILDIGHSAAGTDFAAPDVVAPGVQPASVSVVDSKTVTGDVRNTDDNYSVYFAAKFSRPFSSFGSWNTAKAPMVAGQDTASGNGAGSVVTFDALSDQVVKVKVGISFVSRANAMENLQSELPDNDFDFDALRDQTRSAWNEALDTIRVEGATFADKRVFYTALYHAQHHPNIFEDANGQYIDNKGVVHTAAGYTYYTNFSLWDTYRTENQLLALIQPERFKDMMHSLLVIAQDGGRLPRWQFMNDYADFMIGEPAVMAIVDGYCRGLVPTADVTALYAAMRDRTLDPARHRDPTFLSKGYVPQDVSGGGASRTMEHAIADFALALMADRLATETGNPAYAADRDALLALADNWREVFDPETKFVRPRMNNGTFMTNYHPELPDGFVEGNGWQYSWLVPQDPRGLADALGGDKAAQDRLDTFFSTFLSEPIAYAPAEVQKHMSVFGIAYYGTQYSPANEHDLQAPWLYNYVGQPWKTQAITRGLQGIYHAAPDGLPGNDDLGTMSAWYIWSALGFYPETAGAPLYAIGSPVFETASINVPGGRFTVNAPGASLTSKYVQSATLNGTPTNATWFTHAAFTPGGSLDLPMGPLANTSWGTAPPSMTGSPLSAFGC